MAAGSGDLATLARGDHKDDAMRTAASGLAVVVRRLYDEGKLGGILAMGGTGGTGGTLVAATAFFGASSIERLPTERAITGQVRAFKELPLR